MVNLLNSTSALDKFAEKIDFANLKGTPEDFYKAGIIFLEKGQFDDGILEFVKIIKLAPTDSELYRLAVKELKGMGFSDSDFGGDTSLKNDAQVDKKSVSGGTKFLIVFLAFIVGIFLLGTAASGFDGVIFILAFLGVPLLIIALIVGGAGFYVSEIIGNKKSQPLTNRTSFTKTDDGNALEKFIEKIDFSKLTEKPDHYYKTGIALIEKGQYDDGIIEFTKVIKTTSVEDELYAFAQKELEGMGFSKTDINGIRKHKNT